MWPDAVSINTLKFRLGSSSNTQTFLGLNRCEFDATEAATSSRMVTRHPNGAGLLAFLAVTDNDARVLPNRQRAQ